MTMLLPAIVEKTASESTRRARFCIVAALLWIRGKGKRVKMGE
jgi:hypothetical protein